MIWESDLHKLIYTKMHQKYIFKLVHYKHVPNIVGHLSPVKPIGKGENKINKTI